MSRLSELAAKLKPLTERDWEDGEPDPLQGLSESERAELSTLLLALVPETVGPCQWVDDAASRSRTDTEGWPSSMGEVRYQLMQRVEEQRRHMALIRAHPGPDDPGASRRERLFFARGQLDALLAALKIVESCAQAVNK